MTVSSRTPEGMPSRCPLCGAATNIVYSDPGIDAPCPNCGHLLWASAQLLQSLIDRFEETFNTAPGAIAANSRLTNLGFDSLETVELVMALEEEYDVSIPDEDAERIQSIGDAVRYIASHRQDRSEENA